MFLTVNETTKLIEEGKLLHIAGDESLLAQLPKGNWIGGTTPYFITNKGGVLTREKVFVNEIPDALEYRMCEYNAENITDIIKDTYMDGVTFLIIPFASEAAAVYSRQAPHIAELVMMPVVGWISGFDLSTDGSAKTYNGTSGKAFGDEAVALHIKLPKDKLASIGIVNIFESTETDAVIEFDSDELEVTDCLVNGKTVNFCDYINQNQIDTKMPLVANYNGVYINVSVKAINTETKTVSLYAPVFAGEQYCFAKSVESYETAFHERLKAVSDTKPVFACNCILNYLYGNLEGKATPPFEGPVTFGEVAYQLLNQTLVYLEY